MIKNRFYSHISKKYDMEFLKKNLMVNSKNVCKVDLSQNK
jgi:hypothetical protein